MIAVSVWILQIVLVPAIAPLLIGITRKIKALFQNRQGASIVQPYKDFWKLFHKDEVVSTDASWIFRFAPYIIFTTTLVIAGSIPLVTLATSNVFVSDFLLVVYLLALGTFFLALSGIDVGSSFGGFGSSREMMVSALAEGGLILSLLVLALLAGTTNLFSIAQAVAHIPPTHIAPLELAFMSFFIALLAETSRYPFDNPATHLELTMIHEAMILEYSGKRLALIEWASANKYAIFLALGSQLFFPWGIAEGGSFIAVVSAFVALILKLCIGCAVIATIESSIAKLRIFKLPALLFTSFVLSVVALGFII